MKKELTVAVAMSGGVDSSVAATLLKERGYDVFGITMDNLPRDDARRPEEAERHVVPAAEGAERVCRTLGIPHHVLDLHREFEQQVIRDFVDIYLEARTPNPCVVCNRKIKFGMLLDKALELGADKMATGHYVRSQQSDAGRELLFTARDTAKDQTYVLYALSQQQLQRALFPLGELTKAEVRRIALEHRLPSAKKQESQEICFITSGDYRGFIDARVGEQVLPGPFLDTAGNEVGRHQGIAYYTVGQRRGLQLALGFPAYVVDIDPKRNAVIVGRREEAMSRELRAEANNFLPFDVLEDPMQVEAKVRYKSKAAPAVIYPEADGGVRAVFEEPQWAITPGQAAVYYSGEMLVGGGTIVDRGRFSV